MATWKDLDVELDLWRAAGEVPTFWWRDDDTQAPSDALERLIALAESHAAPLHLAVIPQALDPALAGFLDRAGNVLTMQHGFAHKNHEPKGLRASEVGNSRPPAALGAELSEGWARMEKAGLPRRVPVFVPPWNRIGDQVIPRLFNCGYRAVSCFDRAPRSEPGAEPGLTYVNGHIEPLRWRPEAIFAGVEKTLDQCVQHLRDRRMGVDDKHRPTGLVTHHLVTPEEAWAFCDRFADQLAHRKRARWIAVDDYLKDAPDA